MSYSEDVVASKLSSLNETQESIVNIAQWVMFHRRYAEQTVRTWTRALADAANHRKLGLIYLANEVVQQSRARKKEEFLTAFEPTVAESMETTYRQLNADLRAKVRRVVDVWRQRQVFRDDVLADIEARLGAVDKGRPKAAAAGRKIGGGMSLLGSGVPTELSKLVAAHQKLTAAATSATVATSSANRLYGDVVEADQLPGPAVYADQLEKVVTALDAAVAASREVVAGREDYLAQLEKVAEVNRAALEAERAALAAAEERRAAATATRDEVAAMAAEADATAADDTLADETLPDAPDPEYTPLDPAVDRDDARDTPRSTDSNGLEGLDPAVAQFLSTLVQNEESAASGQ
ncbi:RNA polymerase II-binding domain-containing protein [Dipodascopsis tothii]|uniref:RNA polymerase II-binding domain-containing protein n=1 Tax=Dipodascopsis tothii TaxID=44089 RepID=UPI0034CDA18B